MLPEFVATLTDGLPVKANLRPHIQVEQSHSQILVCLAHEIPRFIARKLKQIPDEGVLKVRFRNFHALKYCCPKPDFYALAETARYPSIGHFTHRPLVADERVCLF